MSEGGQQRTTDGPPDRDPEAGSDCARIEDTAAAELEGLFRYAIARLGRKTHLAEDVVQQALVIAMTHDAPPIESPRQRAWLRGIVHNVIRREMRTKRRGREAIERMVHAVPPSESAKDDGASADHTEDARMKRTQALFLAITSLSRADQDLFYAFYRAGQSQASIADELGTTTKGVEARLYRMRSRLRSVLSPTMEELL